MTVNDDDILELLPEHLHEPWDGLRERTLEADEPLTVGLVGPFSVGKSSLVNTLLEQDILPVGQTETTALPTFVEAGPEWEFGHGRGPEEVREITEEEFRDLAEESAEPGQYTTMTAPVDWLKGYRLVDLPGLGSVDEDRRASTRAQIASVDVVLYMLDARGPTRRDIDHISHACNRGKHVKLLAGQWDRIVKSHEEHDEPMVDLEDWSASIEEVTGEQFEILPVSRTGHGREELISYLASLRERSESIRLGRFHAEARALIENAVADLQDERATVSAKTDEEIEQLRSRLQEQRNSLLAMKEELYAERNEHREEMKAAFDSARSDTLESLEERLEEHREPVFEEPNEKTWSEFVDNANRTAERQLGELTERVQAIHGDMLDVEDLEADWSGVHLQFPSPPDVDREEFFDSARREELREQLTRLSSELESEKDAEDSDVDAPDIDEATLREKIQQLRHTRDEIANEELPEQRNEYGGSSAGSVIGKTVGEISDIGLMFVQPGLLAGKVASWLGKGGKALNLGARGTKMVESAQKAVKAAGSAADKAVSVKKKSTLGEPLDKTGKLARTFGFLEKFSLSYWLEKVGGWFDTPPTVDFEVDPEAMEEQQRAIERVNAQISDLRDELESVKSAQHRDGLTDYERKLKEREQERLQKKLEQQEEEAERRRAEAERERKRRLEERVERETRRLAQQLRYQLVQQARGLKNQLNDSFKAYWEDELEEALEEKEERLQVLEAKLDEKPEARKRQVAALDERVEQLRSYADTLD